MQLPEEEEKKYIQRLLESRLRILCKQGFYGSLLMHMEFAVDDTVNNVASDRKKIYFNPSFLDKLSNRELDFVVIHEVVHLSLRHNSRIRAFEDKSVFDQAADIVVNSNIYRSYDMKEEYISIGNDIQPHTTSDGDEGYDYSVDELYKLLVKEKVMRGGYSSKLTLDENGKEVEESDKENGFDDHSKWGTESDDGVSDLDWEKYTLDACETLLIRDPSNKRGLVPGYAARLYMNFKESKTDWRTLINNFIQEEVNDYSFSPPDRRFSDSPFFLPDFNDADEIVKGVLFMIDTSGSMSDSEITDAYSEVKGAVDQFGGKLEGWLGFFDAAIVEPKPFCNESELEIIKPYGGGGTDFSIIFSYVRDHMKDKNITSIVILTDGYAPWPNEVQAMGIPTIWLIDNDEQTPPWGKVARYKNE